jgi:regulator of RNase E activity RraA
MYDPVANPVPYRIVKNIQRPSAETIEQVKGLGIAPLGGLLHGSGVVDAAIQPLKREWLVYGPAFTVHLPEPDVALVMLAIDLAQEGDVIVVAAGGKMTNLCYAGGMARSSNNKKLAGAVVDGAVSNYDSLVERHNFPIWARGITTGHRVAYVSGSINVPVHFGGVLVNPGDIVVGCGDGVMVVPPSRVQTLVDSQKPKEGSHDRTVDILRAGGTVGQSLGVEAKFRAKADIEWVE